MMDSYPNRANTIFYTFGQCMGIFAVLCHLTAYLYEPSATAGVAHERTYDLTTNTYYKSDQANIEFSIDIDIATDHNWNTNLFFLMVIASYETPTNKYNKVTLWDQIITKKDKTRVQLDNVMNKYPLRDFDHNLRNKNVTLEVQYRVMPITGIFFNRIFTEEGKDSFEMPGAYFRKKGTKVRDGPDDQE